METSLRVSGSSNVRQVAWSIFCSLKETPTVKVYAMGVPAVNQAAKAIAVARGFVANNAEDLWTRVGFETVSDDGGEDRSAVIFLLSKS